jgi:hypothetical protein
MTPEALGAADIGLLTRIGFMAAGASLPRQATAIFESLALLRPRRAFAYIGMATLQLNAGQAEAAVAAIERGQRMLGAAPSAAEPAQTAEDRASLAAWRGLTLHFARRGVESQRALRQAADGPASAPGVQMARRMLGLPTPAGAAA